MRCPLPVLIVLLAASLVQAQYQYPNTIPQDVPYPKSIGGNLPPGNVRAEGEIGGSPSMAVPAITAPSPYGSPSPRPANQLQYQYQVVPPAPDTPPTIQDHFHESNWYTRIDYYHWNERLDGADFVNEYGTLITIGYERRYEEERYRAEVFGATMKYVGNAQFDDGTTDPLHSTTKYMGFRLEYDMLFEPEGLPQVSFFAGLGTRFWIRDMKDDISDSGYQVTGYQETWWTVYPYIGIEKRRTHDEGVEFYYSARIGCTPFTYQRIEDFATTLYPQIGLTGQLEAGIRGRRFLLSAYFEAMGWNQSDTVRDSLQPASYFTTIGFKAGLSF